MAKAAKKTATEASNIFHNIMQASVKDNPKPKANSKIDINSVFDEINKHIASFNSDFTADEINGGLQDNVELNIRYLDSGRQLEFKINPNLPEKVKLLLRNEIPLKASKYPKIIASSKEK